MLAYLDVGTIESYRSWYGAAKRYRLDYWGDWGEWYANVNAPGYRRLLVRRVAPGMLAKGFDGLFLDNTDMTETHPAQKPGMRRSSPGCRALVRARGKLLLAQNGADVNWPLRRFYDGINFEDVSFSYDFDRRRLRQPLARGRRREREHHPPLPPRRPQGDRNRLPSGRRRRPYRDRRSQRLLGRSAPLRLRYRALPRTGTSVPLRLITPAVSNHATSSSLAPGHGHGRHDHKLRKTRETPVSEMRTGLTRTEWLGPSGEGRPSRENACTGHHNLPFRDTTAPTVSRCQARGHGAWRHGCNLRTPCSQSV